MDNSSSVGNKHIANDRRRNAVCGMGIAQEAKNGPASSLFSDEDLHTLVTKHGPEGAVKHAERVVFGRASFVHQTSMLDVLAGRSGRRVADTAAATAVRELEGGVQPGASYSAWCLAGLPHRERPAGQDWLVKTDFAQLLVRPGVRLRDDDTREDLAVPCGTLARLLLIDWQSEAYERGSREIDLGRSPGALLNRMGLSRGGPVSRKLADQIERLSTCRLDFKFGNDRAAVVVNERIVEAFSYVGEVDPRTKRTTRFIERIILSEAFYQELRKHPVLVDRQAIRDIQTSPRAIDVYLWLAFRLHALETETPVSWTALWRQFGREFRTLKSFKAEFQEPLGLALAAYSQAKVRISEKGVLLIPSPPPVAR